MKEEFHIHNLFRESPDRFSCEDPHLRRAALQPFAYVSPLVNTPEFLHPGILMLTGGRQAGKTTCLKQFIAKLLREGLIQPDHHLFEVLRGILRMYATQVSWITLAKDLSIEHHKTVSDYVAILQDMHAVVVQEALAEHTLSAAPKKAKKLYFEDPFIFHAVERMLEQSPSESTAALVETVAVTHFCRKFGKVFYQGKQGRSGYRPSSRQNVRSRRNQMDTTNQTGRTETNPDL